MRSLSIPISLLLISVTFVLAVEGHADESKAAFDKAVLPYFETHCLRCHNADKQKGDFRIDNLSRNVGHGPDVKHWAEIMERISSGEMPPDDVEEFPSAEESQEVVAWLSARIKEGEAERLAKREPVSFHRLSREEYANTIYDLLGVHYDASDPGGLTEDPEWHGFERIGTVLSLSASHVEKYFTAAETVLSEAYPEKEPEPIRVLKRGLDLRGGPTKEDIEELEAQGLADKVRVDMWPGHRIMGGRGGPGRLTSPGVYRVRLQASGLQPIGGRAPHLTFYAEKQDRMLFETDVLAPEDKPQVFEFTAHLPEGSSSYEIMNDVPGPSILPRSGRSGRKPFISLEDGRIPWQLKLTDEEGHPLYPFLLVDWVEWEGPIITDEEKALRAEYMPEEEGNMDQLKAGLVKFATRAFRRPVTEDEMSRYMSLVESELEAGAPFQNAAQTAMLAILCSKDFYYIVEGTSESMRPKLNDWELATRLSYFLWSSMPDERLFTLAEKGTLHQKDVLKAEFQRMLAHPKAERFKETFPFQWLQLRKVGMFAPDVVLYPEYDRHLELSMIQETTEFFGEVLDQNLSLREFLVSDWTMANPRLAIHYGLPSLKKDTFQRVSLGEDTHRGGLLTQGSILSLTSDGQRHRPVHRGVWVMESIFGKSPPPPPANVDPIEPNPIDAPKATIRMKLEAHKRDPNCASCHAKIDPLGLAFDNYDAIGQWRTTEKVQGQGPDPIVSASGVLPDGRSYGGPEEFKQLLAKDLDPFCHTFVKKLATYSLRRTMTIDDQEDLTQITRQAKRADYAVQDIVEAFVLSDLFQKR